MTEADEPEREATMLLARVAESVYWAGRYLERAEATARLVETHTALFLDLPKVAGLGWTPLLAVTGSLEPFSARHGGASEEGVVRFLCADAEHPGSIVSSLAAARRNLRVTRAAFPYRAWEVLNSLYHDASEHADHAVDRRYRFAWLEHVVRNCELLAGLVAGSMNHDEAYAFFQVGRFVERADMTTRVLDVQAGILLGERDATARTYDDVTWRSVLRSVCADQAFRARTGMGASGVDVLRFLLADVQFPRSVAHCLAEAARWLLELPRHEEAMRACAAVQQSLEDAPLDAIVEAGLHEHVDSLQTAIAQLHREIAVSYFEPAASAAVLQAS